MARLLGGSGAALALFGGVAFASAPTLASDFFEEGDFGGTYSYIGPGVAALPDMDVDVGPLGAGVYSSLVSRSCRPLLTIPRRLRPGRRLIRKPSRS